MRRRALPSLLAGTDVVDAVGCLDDGSAPAETGDTAETASDATNPASTTASSGLGSGSLSLVVNTVNAQGSSAGEARISAKGAPAILDLFAMQCAPRIAQTESLRTLREEFGDDVMFVSVTNKCLGGGLTVDDVRGWWAGHDGNWMVGHDPDSNLMRAVCTNGLPYLVIFDTDGEATWTHRGFAGEENFRAAVEDAA